MPDIQCDRCLAGRMDEVTGHCVECDADKPIKLVCEHCGSEDVGRDAVARWDVEKQDFVLAGVHDGAWCQDCDSDSLLEASAGSPLKAPSSSRNRLLVDTVDMIIMALVMVIWLLGSCGLIIITAGLAHYFQTGDKHLVLPMWTPAASIILAWVSGRLVFKWVNFRKNKPTSLPR